MDAKKLIKTLALNPVMQSSMALGTQLGIPWLEKKKNMLLICFRPHRETYENGGVSIYPQQYKAVWAYPFTRLVMFIDLTVEKEINMTSPLCVIPDDRMLSSGKYYLNELYDECSRVLTVWDETGNASDTLLRNYQQKYHETVALMGLEKLYA